MNNINSFYNKKELGRAKASLKTEVEMGSLRFLRNKFSISDSSSFPNVWEGDNDDTGLIKDTFPMPLKCGQSEPETFSDTSSTDLNSRTNDFSKSNVQTSNSPSVLSSSNATDLDAEDDCVILEEEKEIIEIESDNSGDGSDDSKSISIPNSVSNSVLSNDEIIHWQGLIKLQKEISAAKSRFKKINSLFRFNKNLPKACDGLASLHGHIIDLVSNLGKAKDNIDTYRFNDSLTQDISEKCLGCKENPQSYRHTWTLLNKLCAEFVRVRKRRRAILFEFEKFKELSPEQFRKDIQRIRVKKDIMR